MVLNKDVLSQGFSEQISNVIIGVDRYGHVQKIDDSIHWYALCEVNIF